MTEEYIKGSGTGKGGWRGGGRPVGTTKENNKKCILSDCPMKNLMQ